VSTTQPSASKNSDNTTTTSQRGWQEILLNRKMLICILLGFMSGLPLYVSIQLVPAWLRSEGVDLSTIGLFALVQIPYAYKFLWSPLLDRYPIPKLGRRRGWMVVTQLLLFLSIGSLGHFNPESNLQAAVWLVFIVALFSASQDIVIDAYRRDLLDDDELGTGNSIAVNAYRLSSLIPGSLALILSDHMPWSAVYWFVGSFMLLGMFIHIKRISAARTNPAKGLAAGTLLAMLAVSLWKPALSQAPANLDRAVTEVGLDWVFLNTYPLIDSWGPGQTWALLVGLSCLLTIVPWLPSRRPEQTPIAVVDPENCNGCGWCLADCPYEAVTMKEHDFKSGHQQSVVDPDLCLSCGICAGACPSSSPFRHVDELTTGISIPGFHIKELLSLTENKLAALATGAPRIMLYGCDHGSVVEPMASDSVAAISMPCSALVPPAFVDYVLRKNLADGVVISGCCEGDCHYRLGNSWLEQRFSQERMPILRTRVPRERVRLRWLGEQGTAQLREEIGDFQRDQPFTHSEWIRTSKIDQFSSPVARMDEQDSFRGWDLFFANGQLAVHIIQSWADNAIKVTTQGVVIKQDTWHHVCVTWDGSGKPEGIAIYIDGKRQPTVTNTNTLEADADVRTDTPLRIGQRSQGSVFVGSVQDFHLFDRQLSEQEIDALGQSEWLARTVETPVDQRTEAQQAALLEHYLARYDAEFVKLASTVEQLKNEQAAIEARSPVTHVQAERTDQPPMANILMRGQYDNVGDEVAAATPAALHPLAEDAPQNRLGLAQWVIDPNNPLTARVTVNRFWQQLFGQGIVATPEDFGIMGAPPSNPELLDWLATDFVEHGWDVKRFFKQVLMSATYRQAAITTREKLNEDRDNQLLSRGPRFRMDAEMVRDYALTVSGLRSDKMYGPGVKPYQPSNIWNMVGLPGGDTREYQQDRGENLYRRSIYMFWKRMAPPPSLEAFGAPNREVCTVRRERTNTPLQALVTLNDPQFVEAARKLAERALKGRSDASSIANAAAQRVLSRSFSDRELKLVLATLQDYTAHYAANPEDAAALIKIGESQADDQLDPQSLAAWTIVCNQIMNLDEALNK